MPKCEIRDARGISTASSNDTEFTRGPDTDRVVRRFRGAHRETSMFASVLVLTAVMFFFDDASKADLEKLQGTWQVVSMEIAGTKASGDDVKKLTIVFKGNEAIPQEDGKSDDNDKAVITLDASKTPKNIDFKEKEGTKHGIYVLEGDTMKFCVKVEGEGRPKDFAAGEGSGCVLMVLKKKP